MLIPCSRLGVPTDCTLGRRNLTRASPAWTLRANVRGPEGGLNRHPMGPHACATTRNRIVERAFCNPVVAMARGSVSTQPIQLASSRLPAVLPPWACSASKGTRGRARHSSRHPVGCSRTFAAVPLLRFFCAGSLEPASLFPRKAHEPVRTWHPWNLSTGLDRFNHVLSPSINLF